MPHVLIVHGWSDTSETFVPLAKFLAANNYQAPTPWLGDYISMEDAVRVHGVAIRMAEVIERWLQSGALKAPFDMIVHGAGGLVARAWLQR